MEGSTPGAEPRNETKQAKACSIDSTAWHMIYMNATLLAAEVVLCI